jgi:hypothetical protein
MIARQVLYHEPYTQPLYTGFLMSLDIEFGYLILGQTPFLDAH